jgi:predicted nucleic acid-binding protein
MSVVFADTHYFLAVANPRDPFHTRAVAAHRGQAATVLTTQWVLIEVGNGLSKRHLRGLFQTLIGSLEEQGLAEIIPASPDLFSRGCALYFSRLDKEWSLTDCISFVVMRDRNLTDALTGDHHFEQAGFRALLR